jgi:predicted PurR-regulated permease PerM
VIGPTTVIITAAVVGFATGNTLADALVPPLIILAIDTVEANFVQPWLLSRRIVISPIAIFIMVVGLVWMWGPPAAITAVPMLIIFHTVSLHVPSLRPMALLLARETDHGDGTHGLGLRARRQKARAARTATRKAQPAAEG